MKESCSRGGKQCPAATVFFLLGIFFPSFSVLATPEFCAATLFGPLTLAPLLTGVIFFFFHVRSYYNTCNNIPGYSEGNCAALSFIVLSASVLSPTKKNSV